MNCVTEAQPARASRRAGTRGRRSPSPCSTSLEVDHGVAAPLAGAARARARETARAVARRRSSGVPRRRRAPCRARAACVLAADRRASPRPSSTYSTSSASRAGSLAPASVDEHAADELAAPFDVEEASVRRLGSRASRTASPLGYARWSQPRASSSARTTPSTADDLDGCPRRHAPGDRVAPGARACRTAASTSGLDEVRRNIFEPLDESWWSQFTAAPTQFLDAGDRGRRPRPLPRARPRRPANNWTSPSSISGRSRADKAIRFRQFLDTAGWVEALTDLIIDTTRDTDQTRPSEARDPRHSGTTAAPHGQGGHYDEEGHRPRPRGSRHVGRGRERAGRTTRLAVGLRRPASAATARSRSPFVTPLTGGAGFLGAEQMSWAKYAVKTLAPKPRAEGQARRRRHAGRAGRRPRRSLWRRSTSATRASSAILGPSTSGAVAASTQTYFAAGSRISRRPRPAPT